MKKFYYLISIFAVLSLGACQNEEDWGAQGLNGSEVKIAASLENGTDSRTELNSGKIFWEENDALSVFLGNATKQQATIIKETMEDTYAQFKISAGSDVILGGGTEDNENYFANVAYYPYGDNVTVAKDGDNYIVSAVFPAEQSFKDGSFGTNVYPMVAVSDGLNFGFRNVAGMIHIPLKGTATITKVTVESQNHKLAGNYQVTASADAVPTMEMASDATNKITLDCGTGVTLNENTALGFDFVLPVGTYEGGDLTFTFYDNNKGYMKFVAANDDKVERSKRTMFSEKTYNVTGYDLADDAVAWIGNNTFTSISLAVEASQANDVINVKPGTYTEVVKVTGGKNVTIQPANEGDEVTIAGIDHQSNANHSTVIFNNLTIDNSLQTEGWFTGTSPKIKPCVGAWGGNFTFEGCKFIVEGTSGKETGVMTWWVTNKMSLTFNDCTFEGKNNHTSARAMQIYGNADLNVTDCTFNTYKDYSLKYVAAEGNVATFNGNKVYNTENFVQLGSAPYAGSKYTVKINNTTLGEGVSHYYIDNDEDQMVYIDGSLAVAKADELYKLAQKVTGDVKIVLVDNITLGNETEKCMAVNFANVTKLTIDGNDKTLTLKGKDASGSGSVGDEQVAGILATGADVTIKNLTIINDKLSCKGTETSAGRNTVYSFVRGVAVTYEDVTFDGGVQVEGNETFRRCNFTETVLTADADGYAKDGRFCMFIDHEYDAAGTYEVTLEGCTFNASGYGCVKVSGDKGANITVNVKDCSFTNTCPSNSWSKTTPKYDIKKTGSNITVNDQGGNTWSTGGNAGIGEG